MPKKPTRPKPPKVREKEIQRGIVRTYRQYGCWVVQFSQPFGALQTPGIPDLKVYHPETKTTWWHEVKRPKGKQSPAQQEFQRMAELCGEVVLVGGLRPAFIHMAKVGLVSSSVADAMMRFYHEEEG
jgi:hypothetical protein